MKYKLIMFAFAFIFLLSFASAGLLDSKSSIDIGNKQSITLNKEAIPYSPIWEKYNPVKIDGLLGLGSTKWAGAITKHTDNCGSDCESIIRVCNYEDTALYEELNFYDITNGQRKLININNNVQIQTGTTPIVVNDYEEVCDYTSKGNETIKTCEKVLSGTHTENQPIFEDYNLEKANGCWNLKITAEKELMQVVDWVLTTKNEEITEWAVYGTGLVAYFALEETSGNATDITGEFTTNTINITAYSQTGKIGNAFNFSRSGIANNTNLGISTYPFTWNVWVKSNQTQVYSEPTFIAVMNDSTNTDIFLGFTSGNYTIFTRNESGSNNKVTSNITANNNSWVMVSAVFKNETNRQLWINGVNVGNDTTNIRLDNGIQRFSIGEFYNRGAPYVGMLDEIGIWNIALSKSDIAELYDGGNGVGYQTNVRLISPLNAYSTLANNLTLFNISATSLLSNITNISLLTNYSGTWAILNTTTFTPDNTSRTAQFNNTFTIAGTYLWGARACFSDGNCSNSISNYTFIVTKLAVNSISYNSTSVKSTTEPFVLNITTDGTQSPSAILYYNGTAYTSTKSGSNPFTFTNSIVANVTGNNSFYWNITYGSNTYQTPTNYQVVSALQLGLCNATLTVPYLNFTFKDEVSSSTINASADAVTILYGISSQSETYTYSNTSLNYNYAFCVSPSTPNLTASATFKYAKTNYPQRQYYNSSMTLTNSSTNITLYLLGVADGIYTSFQVVSGSVTPIPGATVTIARAGYGTIESKNTDDSGIVTFFVNPNFVHTLTVSKTGYTTSTQSITPTQTQYTITLEGGTTGRGATDLSRGISYFFLPRGRTLFYNTVYNFNITLNSTYYVLDNYGIIIKDVRNNVIVNSNDTSTGGGTVNVQVDTKLNKTLYMMGYYTINGTTVYIGSFALNVLNESDTQYGIKRFFTDLSGYLNDESDEDGLYGIKNDSNGKYSFSLAIILFVLIFGTTGFVGYQFGLNQNFVVMLFMTFMAYLVEVAYPLIDVWRVTGINLVQGIPVITIGLALITAFVVLWEGGR